MSYFNFLTIVSSRCRSRKQCTWSARKTEARVTNFQFKQYQNKMNRTYTTHFWGDVYFKVHMRTKTRLWRKLKIRTETPPLVSSCGMKYALNTLNGTEDRFRYVDDSHDALCYNITNIFVEEYCQWKIYIVTNEKSCMFPSTYLNYLQNARFCLHIKWTERILKTYIVRINAKRRRKMISIPFDVLKTLEFG